MEFRTPKSRLAYPILLESIESSVGDWLSVELPCLLRHCHSRSSMQLRCRETETALIEWLRPFVDLQGFDYCYPTEGITGGLSYWKFQESRNVYRLRGDYTWLSQVSSDVQVVDGWRSVPSSGVLYLSSPSAIDGNYFPEWNQLIGEGPQIVLDLAYFGSSDPKKIEINDRVEKVFYSLSKGFGLNGFRAGWMFSREPVQGLETLREYSYASMVNVVLTQYIISTYGPDFLYRQLSECHQVITKRLGLRPSDSVYFGLTESDTYSTFRREDLSFARVPMNEFYGAVSSESEYCFSYKVEKAPSRIHGVGLFAKQVISKGEEVIRAGGRLASGAEASKMRGGCYSMLPVPNSSEWLVTPSKSAFNASCLNHSCSPNLSYVYPVWRAKKDILPGEELLTDYRELGYKESSTLVGTCNCGAQSCVERL